jgi:hypothetical protein
MVPIEAQPRLAAPPPSDAPTSAWPPKSSGCSLTDAEAKALVSEMKRQAYSEQWAFFAEATQVRCLTMKQLRTVLYGFPHTSDLVRVLRWVGPRVVDPQNGYLLEDRLSYGEEKKVCKELFICCQASCASAPQ